MHIINKMIPQLSAELGQLAGCFSTTTTTTTTTTTSSSSSSSSTGSNCRSPVISPRIRDPR